MSGHDRSFSEKMAIFFAVFLAFFEVIYNWSNPSWWPFILVDYICVALLLYGALYNRSVLIGGWGFTCGMFYVAFFLVLEKGKSMFISVGAGILFLVTIVGLVLAILEAGGETPNNHGQ
ncbi:hypothetical protein HXX02_07395, partial [Microbulbifer elongatus]